MKYLFFLVILLIPMGIANAEVGKNFDTEVLDNGLTKWTSHYERIFDGDSWENYILTNTGSQVKFDSAGISFLYNKTNCDFKLYDPETNDIAINSYKFGLAIDSIPTPLPFCNVVDFETNSDTISFTIDNGEFKTLFDLDPSIGMEWTHEVQGKSGIITITETCQDCVASSVDGNRIDFGSYILDTKNEVHNTVKETKADKGDYIIQFEKAITDKDILIIDPTFTSANPTVDGDVRDSDNDNLCEASPASAGKDTASVWLAVGREDTTQVNDCDAGFIQWDT